MRLGEEQYAKAVNRHADKNPPPGVLHRSPQTQSQRAEQCTNGAGGIEQTQTLRPDRENVARVDGKKRPHSAENIGAKVHHQEWKDDGMSPDKTETHAKRIERDGAPAAALRQPRANQLQ